MRFLGGQNLVQKNYIVSSQNCILLYLNEERKKHLPIISILARSSTSHKLLLVGTLKEMGVVVVMIGYGTKHESTIQEVDVRASKESSDIVIMDEFFH